MSSSRTNLTTLPFELQAQIFRHYFKADGGYVFNGDSEKLTTANGNPIDLALMSTCRSIAKHTKDMPLSINTVHFSTVYRRDWMPFAGCFNFVSTFYRLLEEDMLRCLARFMTPEMYSQLALKFPTFVSQIQQASREMEAFKAETQWRSHSIRIPEGGFNEHGAFMWQRVILELGRYWGLGYLKTEEHSTRWVGGIWAIQGAVSCLRLIAEKEPAEFAKLVYEAFPHWVDTHPAHEFLDLGFSLWDIPSRSELAVVASRLEADNTWQLLEAWYYRPSTDHRPTSIGEPLRKAKRSRCREKARFSAAAVAIRFLKRLPVDARRQFRNVTLHEDLAAVGTPSAHVQGLAPFFKENPQLRVERRVSVTRCIVERDRLVGPSLTALFLEEPGDPDFELCNSMKCYSFSPVLAQWLLDALAVPDAGIPVESFTFVLEGGPFIDFCSDVFQHVVHRDIARHRAYEACIQRGFLVRPSNLPQDFGLVLKGFEEAIEHLVNQTSFLRSDFNTGHPWDWEDLVEKNKGLDHLEWMHAELPILEFPPALYLESILADNYEIQTEDEYR